MKYVLYSFVAGLFTWLMTAIGSLAIFSVKPTNKKIMSCLMGFGGGVMIAASFFSLIKPSIEYCNILDFNILVLCIIGFLIGTILLITLFFLAYRISYNRALDKHDAEEKQMAPRHFAKNVWPKQSGIPWTPLPPSFCPPTRPIPL